MNLEKKHRKFQEYILGVHYRTLYLWDKKGTIETIRTPGNKRLYNVEKYLKENKENINIEQKLDNLDKNKKRLNLSYV